MPYKCEQNGKDGCTTCVHSENGGLCDRNTSSLCPLTLGYIYPEMTDLCDGCCYEPLDEKGINTNRNIIVVRPKDTVIVRVVLDKNDNLTRRWCFVNLTKGHVCSCRFATYEDAIKDLEERKKSGEVVSWCYEGDLLSD